MSLRDGPFPNGGWRFTQPQFKDSNGRPWETPMPLGETFNQNCDRIIAVRTANSAISKRHGLATDFATVANELEAYTRRRLRIPEEIPPPKTQPPQPPAPVAAVGGVERFLANPIRRIKSAAVALKVYRDTFGDSNQPVEQVESERRASICEGCPKNDMGDWRNFFTEEAAKAIMGVFQIMRNLDLYTSKDQKLGTCSACLCPLRQKVHIKLDFILKNMDEETKQRLDPRCWILPK